MRTLAVLAVLFLLPASLFAQQSGRHFHRPSRTPTTAAATTQPAEAAARTTETQRVAPMRKLRSGRAWSSWHYSRLPQSPATGAQKPSVTDASASRTAPRRSAFWGRVLRG